MLEAESEIMMTRNPTQQAPGIKDKATNTPAVIAWLLTNYALREGAPSLPKAQVYQEYVAYCGEAGLEPTTPPAFGKILRVAFPSIECRRKGPRGEAKHHYKHFCKKSDLALLALPSSSSTSSSAASVNGHISPSPIPTSKFDVSSGTTHRHITSSPASSSASVRLPSLRTTSPFQPIMDDVSHQLYPHRYHGDYHDGEHVDDMSSGAAAAKKRTLDSHGSDPHADLRELLKKKIKSESRGADANPSAHRMRGGHTQQHHGGPGQDNEAELGSSQDQHHKRRRLSQEISNNSNGVEYENNSNSNDDDDEEGAVAEYIRQFKSSTESIDRRKSPSPPPPLQRPSSALGGETATRLDPSPPALPSFNSLAIPLRLPPLPQQPPMTHSMLAPPSGASAVHSRLPSPLDFSSLRSPSPSPAPSPYGHTRSHTATPPPAQFFSPPAPSSSSSGSAGNPPSAPSSSQTALLLSHLQEKEQEVEKLTNELKFLHSRLASTTPIPLPSPSPSPSSSLFPSPHSYSPSPMHHPPSPFAPHAAYMRSSPAPYIAGGHSSSPSPSPSPLHHLHHSFTPLSPPPAGSSSHSASPLSHHHPHARQYFAPILTLEEQQQQQQQQLHHQRDSTTPTLMQTTVTIKRERSSKGRESATRDLMASPGPGVERSSSTSPTHRNRSASPLDADEFSSTSPSSPTSFSSKVMKKEAIPVVVHWIKKNYELSADSSSDLPKEQVYRHYREFCEETGVQQTNCATFGKILRSVFPNLKTRRLGSRGNTKHHYHGIRRRKSPLSTESGAQGGTTSPPPNLNALAVLASISVTGGSPMPSPPGIPPSSSGSPRQQPHAYEDDVDDDVDEDNDNDNEDDMDEEDVKYEGTNGNGNGNDQPLLQSPVPIRPHAKAVGESEEMVNEDDDEQQQQQVASYGWVAGGSGGDFALSSRRCTVEACENRAAAQRTICEKHKKQQQRARLRNSLDAKISSAATIFGATPSSSSSSSSLSSSLSSSSSILPPLSALSLSPASDVPPPL